MTTFWTQEGKKAGEEPKKGGMKCSKSRFHGTHKGTKQTFDIKHKHCVIAGACGLKGVDAKTGLNWEIDCATGGSKCANPCKTGECCREYEIEKLPAGKQWGDMASFFKNNMVADQKVYHCTPGKVYDDANAKSTTDGEIANYDDLNNWWWPKAKDHLIAALPSDK